MFFLIVAGIILAINWYYSNDNLKIKGWSKFKRQIKIDHKYIKDVDFHRNARVISIMYNIDKDVSIMEIEDAFESTKKFILSDVVFLQLEEYQHKKHPDEFYEIYISFKNLTIDSKDRYEFYSINSNGKGSKRYEGFNKWYIEINGKKVKEYSW